jgi:hypothetical protein
LTPEHIGKTGKLPSGIDVKPLTTEEIRAKKGEIRRFLASRGGSVVAIIAKEKPKQEEIDKLTELARLVESSIFDQWFESTLTVLDLYVDVKPPPSFTEEQVMVARLKSAAKTIAVAKDTSYNYANYVITLVLGLYGGLLPDDQAQELFNAKEDDPTYIT